jgi:prepilin peptidase CpaA
MWTTFILAFVLSAAIVDAIWGKIPRLFTTGGLLLGLGVHLVQGGFWSALLAAFIGFVTGLVLFDLGAIGGGDVKLISALGALLGLTAWAFAMQIAIFAAAIIAIVRALRLGVLRESLRNLLEIVRWIAKEGRRPHPVIRVGVPGALGAPFGIAAALGTLAAVVR